MISRVRTKPTEQPTTMLLVMARDIPCRARTLRSSLARWNRISSSSMAKLIGLGTSKLSVPLGPSTAMVCPSVLILTPLGIGMGALPMRDMLETSLPDAADELAADAGTPSCAVGHHSPGGADD